MHMIWHDYESFQCVADGIKKCNALSIAAAHLRRLNQQAPCPASSHWWNTAVKRWWYSFRKSSGRSSTVLPDPCETPCAANQWLRSASQVCNVFCGIESPNRKVTKQVTP